MTKVNVSKQTGLMIGIVFCVLAAVAVFALFRKDTGVSQSSVNESSDAAAASTAGAVDRVYTSAKHGFSVKFPGDPTVLTSSLNFKQAGQDSTVPVTFYKKDDGRVLYQVVVYEYPATFDMSDTDARLSEAVNGSVQLLKSASLVSSNFDQFAGYRSINAVVSVNADGMTLPVFLRGFFKGTTLYLLQTVDGDQATFNSFANTFQFT